MQPERYTSIIQTKDDNMKLRIKSVKGVITMSKGGPGSGHHGHRGRPGKRGGSLPGKGESPGYDKNAAVLEDNWFGPAGDEWEEEVYSDGTVTVTHHYFTPDYYTKVERVLHRGTKEEAASILERVKKRQETAKLVKANSGKAKAEIANKVLDKLDKDPKLRRRIAAMMADGPFPDIMNFTSVLDQDVGKWIDPDSDLSLTQRSHKLLKSPGLKKLMADFDKARYSKGWDAVDPKNKANRKEWELYWYGEDFGGQFEYASNTVQNELMDLAIDTALEK